MARTAVLFAAMAMLAATAPASRAAPDNPMQVAAVLCAGNGCNVVLTKQVKKRKFKPMEYTKPLPKAAS